MTPRALGMIAGLVAIAAIAGWLWLRRGDDATAQSAPQAADTASSPQAPAASASAAPQLPDRQAAATDSDPVTTYQVGNVEVRDHRGSGGAPRDVPPDIRAPGRRELPSALTHAITAPVQAAVIACGASVPADARGHKPRLEGVLTVAIQGHQLAVTESALVPRDVADSAADALRGCVAGKAVGATVPAPDQDDLASFAINISLAIP